MHALMAIHLNSSFFIWLQDVEDLVNLIYNVLTEVGHTGSYEYHSLAQNIANYERKLAQVSVSVAVMYCDIITTEGIIN